MTKLLNEDRTVEQRSLSVEDAFSFMRAVLDTSGDIIAFLNREKCPILLNEAISSEGVSLTNAEMSPVNDPSGNLLGYILRRKSTRKEEEEHDYLTGTLNRAQLEKEFARRCHLRHSDKELTLIFVDLDRFKPVNEQFGHLVGDQVLLQFSALLKNCFRAGDCVARYGGDEFVILCDCAAEIAEKRVLDFRKRLANYCIEISYPSDAEQPEITSGKIILGFSYGMTSVNSNDSFNGALRRADEALLTMKRGRVVSDS